MLNVSNIKVTGRLGKDPEGREIKDTEKGSTTLLAMFSLAFDNGENEEPTWYQVTTYDNQAKYVLENLKKGDQVSVEGYFKVQPWYDEKNDVNRLTLKINPNIILPLRAYQKENITAEPEPSYTTGKSAQAKTTLRKTTTAQNQHRSRRVA